MMLTKCTNASNCIALEDRHQISTKIQCMQYCNSYFAFTFIWKVFLLFIFAFKLTTWTMSTYICSMYNRMQYAELDLNFKIIVLVVINFLCSYSRSKCFHNIGRNFVIFLWNILENVFLILCSHVWIVSCVYAYGCWNAAYISFIMRVEWSKQYGMGKFPMLYM